MMVVSMTARIRIKALMSRILAQDLLEPSSIVERMVACLLGHQQCQALAAAGGGQRPGFTLLVTQPKSATAADGCR